MFLNLLTPREKVAFLALAKKVIISDRVIAPSEETLFKSMQQELELVDYALHEEIKDEDIVNLPRDIAHLCEEFTSRKSKISALMELIGLGFVDGKFVAQEKKVIYEIAQNFGIKKNETDGYIDWASRLYSD